MALIPGPVILTRPDGRTVTIDARALMHLACAAKTLSRDLDGAERREIEETLHDLDGVLLDS